MDCTVHGVAKSQTRLSDFYFLFTQVCINATTNVYSTFILEVISRYFIKNWNDL